MFLKHIFFGYDESLVLYPFRFVYKFRMFFYNMTPTYVCKVFTIIAQVIMMETIIIITNPPMPAGVYTARAVSMLSDKKAECSLKVKGPSVIDRVKDWLGIKLGKIVKK